jgi:hypothetical protein
MGDLQDARRPYKLRHFSSAPAPPVPRDLRKTTVWDSKLSHRARCAAARRSLRMVHSITANLYCSTTGHRRGTLSLVAPWCGPHQDSPAKAPKRHGKAFPHPARGRVLGRPGKPSRMAHTASMRRGVHGGTTPPWDTNVPTMGSASAHGESPTIAAGSLHGRCTLP